MLLIDNDAVKRVLTMRECIEAQERAFAGMWSRAISSFIRPAWWDRSARLLPHPIC